MRNVLILTLSLFVLVGCSSNFQNQFAEIPMGTHANSIDDVAKFSNVYEMWKNNIDKVYIQTGIDEYTNTYLLETMPRIYFTIIKSLTKYDMEAYALIDSESLHEESSGETLERILNYNKEFKESKFKGVNINIDLKKIKQDDLNAYIANIAKAREMINVHNEDLKDNLTLSVNINYNIVSDNSFLNLLENVDEVMYESDSIKRVEELLSLVNEHNKKVSIVLNTNNHMKTLVGLDNKLKILNKYESFNGLIVNDYSK